MSMDDLLPFYERELAFLRSYSRQFSERYPKIAGRLLLAGDVSEDPHVERMIQSFALMGARISKKIEDDYPEFTEALLQVLYPHYLRPFPACSITEFDLGSGAGTLSECVTLPRGTELLSRPVRGVECRFRTVYDVTLAPLRIASARFSPLVQAPRAVQLPLQASAQLSITFELLSTHASIQALGLDHVRLFIDGEPSFCAVLRDVLALNVVKAYLESGDSGQWQALPASPIKSVGFAEHEALIDWPARAHPAYRLLTEFFAFPEKFGFFDCDLNGAQGRRFTLHLLLGDVLPGSTASRLLEGLSAANIRLHCTPVVNLFRQRARPILVSHQAVSYNVVGDQQAASAFEVHAIESVTRTTETAGGNSVSEIRPFYSLHHGECQERNALYWVAHRDEDLARKSPGHELQLTIVDPDMDPISPGSSSLSLELTCSNRNLPEQLAYGVPSGDLRMPGGSLAQRISLLRKPTAAVRFACDRGAQWRLISHLSLNHLSLVEGGAAALREMLKLYDLQRSATTARQIEGIHELSHRPATAWLPGKYFASVARGTEIRLVIDEESFVGIGLHIFAQVVDHFFGLYVHANSFTQLVLISKHSGEEVLRCQPRSGDSILV